MASKLGNGSETELRLPIAALKADPKNPRRISSDAAHGLGISLETFGDLSGIAFNDDTGELVSGHQRLDRLKADGATEVVRTGDTGYVLHPKTGERFPVRFVKWDATKQSMANLVANNPEIGGTVTEDVIEQARSLEDEAHFHELQLDKLIAAEEAKLGSEEGDSAPPSVDLFGVFSKDQVIAESMAYFRAKGFDACCRFPPLHVAMQMINKLAQARGDDACGTTAMQAADRFHPRRFDVIAGGRKTARQAFEDDKILGHAVEWSVSTGVSVGEQWPGKLAIAHGTQIANNFRPGFAAYISTASIVHTAEPLSTRRLDGGGASSALWLRALSRGTSGSIRQSKHRREIKPCLRRSESPTDFA